MSIPVAAESADSLTPAIFGLLGVIVGGLLNGAVGMLTDRHRDVKEAVVAARLVRSEIDLLAAEIEGWLQAGEIPAEVYPLDRSAWDVHEARLARILIADNWELVRSAYVWVGLLNTDPNIGLIDPQHRKHLESIHPQMRAGVVALTRLALGRRPHGPLDRLYNRRYVRWAMRQAKKEEAELKARYTGADAPSR